MQACLHADCTLPLQCLDERKNNNFHKKQAKMLLSPLECIVVVEVSVAVLLLLNIHQMGYFTLLGIFILELFLTREI